MNPPPMEKIRHELEFLNPFEVVLFGSAVEGGFRPGSDLDIAVITRKSMSEYTTLIALHQSFIGRAPPIYDIKIFEALPLTIKRSIIGHFGVIFGDRLELSEYFYFFRKLWNDNR